MKKKYFFMLFTILAMSLSGCAGTKEADGNLEHEVVQNTDSEVVQNTDSENVSDTTNGDEVNKEEQSEIIDYSIPEEFVDYVKFVGKDISVLDVDISNWDFTNSSHELWEGEFYGHKGQILVDIGWDDRTILGFYLILNDDEKISDDERPKLNEKLSELFGNTVEEKNASYEFFGNGDYEFDLPKTLEQESVCVVGWNFDKLYDFQMSKPKPEEEPSKEPTIVIKKEPAIGMTAEEVRASTWGEPKDINKTTTKYRVKEQWVYSGYKYIYLENGIVTTIQE